MDTKNTKDYSASSITVLKGLEAVRKRPAMYIGGTDKTGLHHMIWEIVDNGIDEALAGFATAIKVTINEDGSVTVYDDGRGIPVDIHPTEKKSALELAATVLHAGGKFDKDSYKVSSGLHGVGLSVVNALSEYAFIEVYKNGQIYKQEYKEGVPQTEVVTLGKTELRGTSVTFKPDSKIFETVEFDSKKILDRLRQHAYLNGGIKFEFVDKRKGNFKYAFFFEGGLKSYVRHINKHLKPIHKEIFHTQGQIDGVEIEVALQYTDDLQTREYPFANNVFTADGGTHLTGLRTALTKTINNYIYEHGTEKDKSLSILGDDVREGLNSSGISQSI
ncbi:MAG: hypothetical protein KatS3mg085_385 [Candidatus Dojkabacteria bacterium]|nr:MAG: hypothetical protein KatS3mg085_385 [Candidatus Dojkabacteria bacterium]